MEDVITGFVIQNAIVDSYGNPKRWVEYDHAYYRTRADAENALLTAFGHIPKTVKFRIVFRREEVIVDYTRKEVVDYYARKED